jgi:hypothetical protein
MNRSATSFLFSKDVVLRRTGYADLAASLSITFPVVVQDMYACTLRLVGGREIKVCGDDPLHAVLTAVRFMASDLRGVEKGGWTLYSP